MSFTDPFGLDPSWTNKTAPAGPVHGPQWPTIFVPSIPQRPNPTPHGCTLRADGSVRCGPRPNLPMPWPSRPTIDDDGGPGASNWPLDPNKLPRPKPDINLPSKPNPDGWICCAEMNKDPRWKVGGYKSASDCAGAKFKEGWDNEQVGLDIAFDLATNLPGAGGLGVPGDVTNMADYMEALKWCYGKPCKRSLGPPTADWNKRTCNYGLACPPGSSLMREE